MGYLLQKPWAAPYQTSTREKTVPMVSRKEKDIINSGLRILAQIIARDIYSRWCGDIKDKSRIYKAKKPKERAKS